MNFTGIIAPKGQALERFLQNLQCLCISPGYKFGCFSLVNDKTVRQQRAALLVFFYSEGDFSFFFARQRRHVAPVKVKFDREERTVVCSCSSMFKFFSPLPDSTTRV